MLPIRFQAIPSYALKPSFGARGTVRFGENGNAAAVNKTAKNVAAAAVTAKKNADDAAAAAAKKTADDAAAAASTAKKTADDAAAAAAKYRKISKLKTVSVDDVFLAKLPLIAALIKSKPFIKLLKSPKQEDSSYRFLFTAKEVPFPNPRPGETRKTLSVELVLHKVNSNSPTVTTETHTLVPAYMTNDIEGLGKLITAVQAGIS